MTFRVNYRPAMTLLSMLAACECLACVIVGWNA